MCQVCKNGKLCLPIYEYLHGEDKRFLFNKSTITSEMNNRMTTFC